MTGMAEALWEICKCHSPTLGVAKGHGAVARYSLDQPVYRPGSAFLSKQYISNHSHYNASHY